MDGYRYLQPDNATRSGRRCNGIVSYDTLGDARQPGACADLLASFAIRTRRGGPLCLSNVTLFSIGYSHVSRNGRRGISHKGRKWGGSRDSWDSFS